MVTAEGNPIDVFNVFEELFGIQRVHPLPSSSSGIRDGFTVRWLAFPFPHVSYGSHKAEVIINVLFHELKEEDLLVLRLHCIRE